MRRKHASRILSLVQRTVTITVDCAHITGTTLITFNNEKPINSEDGLRKTRNPIWMRLRTLRKTLAEQIKNKLSSSHEVLAYEFERSEECHRVIRTSKRYSETRRNEDFQ